MTNGLNQASCQGVQGGHFSLPRVLFPLKESFRTKITIALVHLNISCTPCETFLTGLIIITFL